MRAESWSEPAATAPASARWAWISKPRLAGRHAVLNLLAAIAVARVFEIAPERLREPVRTFTTGKMRGERLEHNGIVVWNDCYNSNPEAARSMLDVLRQTPAGRRIAVLGEMLELGQVGAGVASAGGPLCRRTWHRSADRGARRAPGAMVEAAQRRGPALERGLFLRGPGGGRRVCPRGRRAPGDAVLFKGSRGVRVERALERFLAVGSYPNALLLLYEQLYSAYVQARSASSGTPPSARHSPA